MTKTIDRCILNLASAALLCMFASLICLHAGCATDTGDAIHNARARAANAALAEAGRILGRVAVSTLMNVASQEMNGSTVDFGHAASQGLYSNMGSIVTSDGIQRVVSAYSADNLPSTASTAAGVFSAVPGDPAAKAAAIASVIATAAGAPPAK